MSASAKPNEPSMDEILASIRRIIADDEPSPRRPAGRPSEVPSRRAPSEPNRLAGQGPVREHHFGDNAPMMDPAEPMGSDDMADYPFQGGASGAPPLRRPESVREPAAPLRPAPARQPEPRGAEPAQSRPLNENNRRKELLSADVDAAVAAAFETLGDAVLPAHERTVEDLVKEILRPMLKTWLDDNLPRIVERLVRQEIERISRTSR